MTHQQTGKVEFKRLVEIVPEVVEAFDRWENDGELVPFVRPNRCQGDLDRRERVTFEQLEARVRKHHIFLIYCAGHLVGEMSFQIDPHQMYRKVPGSAWIGITIGESAARGKGIGAIAMAWLETQIAQMGLKRIELGVFEFNHPAISLYRKLGYTEIGRIPDFTYFQDRMWQDIRMEKQL